MELEALDEIPDEGRLVQRPSVHQLAACVDVRHGQLLDLQRDRWLGVRRSRVKGSANTGRGATLASVQSARPKLTSTCRAQGKAGLEQGTGKEGAACGSAGRRVAAQNRAAWARLVEISALG